MYHRQSDKQWLNFLIEGWTLIDTTEQCNTITTAVLARELNIHPV